MSPEENIIPIARTYVRPKLPVSKYHKILPLAYKACIYSTFIIPNQPISSIYSWARNRVQLFRINSTFISSSTDCALPWWKFWRKQLFSDVLELCKSESLTALASRIQPMITDGHRFGWIDHSGSSTYILGVNWSQGAAPLTAMNANCTSLHVLFDFRDVGKGYIPLNSSSYSSVGSFSSIRRGTIKLLTSIASETVRHDHLYDPIDSVKL